MDWNQILKEYVFLFAVIDPIGTIPVFMAATAGLSLRERLKIAKNAVLTATGILLGFLILGQVVLEAMGISLPAFQVAGGLVLFIFAMTMVFGEAKPETELQNLKERRYVAVSPLAIPSIASPGAMLAIVLLTDNTRFDIYHQSMTALVCIGVLFSTYMILRLSTRIHPWIGQNGEIIISRVMGLIMSALAVDNVLEGIKTYFGI